MQLPQLTPEQVDLYLKLIGGILGATATIVVTTLLPAIRNFKTAQAAAPAQASSDMLSAAAKLAASVAVDVFTQIPDHQKALEAGFTAGLQFLVSSGIWPTISKMYSRDQLLAAFKGAIGKMGTPIQMVPVTLSPEMEKLLATLPAVDPLGGAK